MRHRFMMLLMAAIPLAGCSAGNSTGPSSVAPPSNAGCVADAAQPFVGQKVTEAIGAAVLQTTGARTLRWGPPRSAWTMDFRSDRVNISYDDDSIIQQISCG